MAELQTTEPLDDTFAAAFAQIAALDVKNEPPATTKKEADEAKPVAQEVKVEPPTAETVENPVIAAPKAEEPAVVEVVKAEEPVVESVVQAQPAISDEELLKRFAKLVKEPPVEPQTQAQPEPQPEPALFSEDEVKFLTEYEKEWPDVARAEALRRRAEYRQVVGYVFQEVSKELQPLAQLVKTLSERTHLGDLHTAVPDYDVTRDKVIEWAMKQPTYLQPAYKHVIERGTVDEVADLIHRYKRDTGTVQTQQTTAPVKKENELPAATKKAVASLAPVISKRSAPVAPVESNDFDGAFAEFASKL